MIGREKETSELINYITVKTQNLLRFTKDAMLERPILLTKHLKGGLHSGMPDYLNYFKREKSLSQIVDEMFFQKGAKLAMEYERLFSSVFTNPEMMMNIVKVLAAKSKGFTRKELSEKAGFSEGGTLTKALKALIASDFVIKYIPSGVEKERHFTN